MKLIVLTMLISGLLAQNDPESAMIISRQQHSGEEIMEMIKIIDKRNLRGYINPNDIKNCEESEFSTAIQPHDKKLRHMREKTLTVTYKEVIK